MKYKLVLKDENGNESTDDRFYYEDGALFFKGVDVRLGNGAHVYDADMEFDAANNKLWVKEGIQMHSIHDSIDIGFGRAGNNGTGTTPITTLPDMRLGWVGWGRSYVEGAPSGFSGWNGGIGFNQFSYCAAFDVQTDGTQTATSRPGSINGYVTRPGNISGTPVWKLKNATQPGETFMGVSWINASGTLVDRDRVFVDQNGFLKVTGVGTPTPPPPATPPTGTYRFLRFEASKIVGGSIPFRLIDASWSADGGATWLPTMTANNAPSPFVASASNETSTDPAYKGMDGNITNTIWNTTQVSDANGNLSPVAWLQIDFGAGNGLTPNRFRYAPTNSGGDRTVVDGRLLGSTTGAFAGEEVVLKTITGETSKPHAQYVVYSIP
jgi:hypothetical protein